MFLSCYARFLSVLALHNPLFRHYIATNQMGETFDKMEMKCAYGR